MFGDPQSSIPILQVRFGVLNRSPTTLCTRPLLPSTHNSRCTPLARLLGARHVDHWLRSNSHADRMQKSHAARSQSQHRAFVTTVNICTQLVILAVRFALSSTQRHSGCFTGSIGSVCARQHTRWSRFSLWMHQILTETPPKLVTTLPSTILLQRQSSFSSSLSNAWTAPLTLESAAIHVEACRHHLLHRLTPNCNSASFFLVFHRVIAPVLCLGSLDLSPRSSGLSSSAARGCCLACALLCAAQGRMSACRTRPAANPGGPQGGAQTGRSPGGGGCLDGS